MLKLPSPVLRALLVATMTVTTLAAVPSPSSAQTDAFATECPEITDSIRRLYSAYFLRDPDRGGFNYWTDRYANGSGLETIATSFANQKEFALTYDNLNDAQFVELVYRNVLDREPDASGLAFWIRSLARGNSRGRVMISFSESEEYVNQTGTTEPLAGLGTWYPSGTKWNCGTGNRDWVMSFTDTPYIDVLMLNTGPSRGDFGVQALRASGAPVDQLFSESINNGIYHFFWNVPLGALGKIGALRVTAPADGGYVTLVAVPRSRSGERPGWGD